MSLHPDKLPLLHGLVDGELDAANTAAIEAHLKGCAECRAELERIEAVRALIGAASIGDRAPDRLRATVEAMVETPRAPARSFDRRWASGALTGAIAASLLLFVGAPQLSQAGAEDQFVQSHIRSMQAAHVVDIRTSNRHVVKPWFDGKVDFAPSVPELAADGFPLIGGRLDYVDGREAAAIVYGRGLHVINLFVRPARGLALPITTTARRDGYNLVRWTAGGLEYWAVSDLDPDGLAQFRQLYTARAAPQ